MQRKEVPFQATAFVCVNAREGKAACGNPGAGGAELCKTLKDEVKRLGLKGTVRVARSGCLDRCSEGPNLFLYPAGEWYSGVSPDDVPEILRRLQD